MEYPSLVSLAELRELPVVPTTGKQTFHTLMSSCCIAEKTGSEKWPGSARFCCLCWRSLADGEGWADRSDSASRRRETKAEKSLGLTVRAVVRHSVATVFRNFEESRIAMLSVYWVQEFEVTGFDVSHAHAHAEFGVHNLNLVSTIWMSIEFESSTFGIKQRLITRIWWVTIWVSRNLIPNLISQNRIWCSRFECASNLSHPHLESNKKSVSQFECHWNHWNHWNQIPWQPNPHFRFSSTQYLVLNDVQSDCWTESCRHTMVSSFYFQRLGAATEAIQTDKMKGKNFYASMYFTKPLWPNKLWNTDTRDH